MMKQFVDLYFRLLESESITLKLKCILSYLRSASEKDAGVAIWLLNANKPHTVISTRILKKWILMETSIPQWLFEESLNVVKDPEETLSLIVEAGDLSSALSFTEWLEENIYPLKSMDINEQKEFFIKRFLRFSRKDRFMFLKLISGKLKLCADKKTVVKALSAYSKLDEEIITYRLSKYNFPEPGCYTRLLEENDFDIANCRPYPFMSASQLDDITEHSLTPKIWLAEWKWKGTRIQIVKRNGKIYIWSKSHEFLSDKFPDLVQDLSELPDDIVLDGQLTSEKYPEAIHKRLNSKISGSLILKYPVKFIAFDILEYEARDLRNQALCERKKHLRSIFNSFSSNCMQQAESYTFAGHEDLNKLRSGINNRFAEGLLIKDFQSMYLTSEPAPCWYAIKKERNKINATLLYVQRDYQNYEPGANTIKIMTFGVPEGANLVSVAKTDCNLANEDLIELEKYIKENTIERVGPIRVLKPGLVFELTFDEILSSKRHKSGVNIISPKISKWMKQLTLNDIDRIDHLRNSALQR